MSGSFRPLRRSRLVSGLFLAYVVTAAGCAGSRGDFTGSQESATSIDPTDNETLGSVLVRRPPAGGVLAFTVRIDDQVATPEQPVRVVEGTHVLSLVQEGDGWADMPRPATVYRRIDVKKNQTTTVQLSAMVFGFTTPDLSEGDLNVLPPPSFELAVENAPFPHDCASRRWTCSTNVYACEHDALGCWSWYVDGRVDQGTYDTRDACMSACTNALTYPYGPADPICAQKADPVCDQAESESLVKTSTLRGVYSGTSASAIALLAGSYTVTSPAGTVAIALAPGAYQLVSQGAGPTTTRASLVVNPPPSREQSNARNDGLVVSLAGAGRNLAAVDTRSTYTVKAVGFSNSPNNASARLGPRTIPLSLVDGQTSTLQLGRIDMADVKINRENGTSYMAHGTYTVTSISDGIVLGSFGTASGIDVLPGDYRVDLAYSTEEGPKAQTFRLHF